MLFVREIIRHASRYKLLSALFLLGVVLEAAYAIAAPASLQYLVDEAFLQKNAKVFLLIMSLLIAGGMLNIIGNYIGDYSIGQLSGRIVRQLREQLFSHLQRMPLTFYQRYRLGDLVTRFSGDMHSIESVIRTLSPFFLRQAFSVALGLIMLFVIEWKLTLAVLAVSFLLFVGPRMLQLRAERANVAYKEAQERFANTIDEMVKGHKAILGLHQQQRFQDRARGQIRELFTLGFHVQLVNSWMERIPLTVLLGLNGIMIGFGGYLIFQDELSVGAFMAFFTLFLSVGQSASNLSVVIPGLVESGVSYGRIRELLDERAMEEPENPKEMPSTIEAIRIEGVDFGYDEGALQLNGVDIEIPGGTFAAFVGPSGSGKSTALQLIARFYEPSRGRVTINGQDLSEIREASLRRAAALVSQDSFFFNATVRDNLKLDRPDVAEEAMIEAARQANIHDVVMRWPDGYDTSIRQEGASLSGGERQRLSIARALLRQPKLLLLDEVTAALDPASEAEINDAVRRLRPNRTIVSVTHRLDSVIDADRIYVFEKGRVAESGTHAELLQRGGLYARLWDKQQGFRLSKDGLHAEVDAERLARFAFFRGIDAGLLEEIAGLFSTELYHENDFIVREGEQGDRFYIIVRGRVEVLKATDRGEARVAVLQDGDYFGEIALLRGIPRTASVRATGRAVLLAARREAFQRLTEGHPQFLASLERVLEQRDSSAPAGERNEIRGDE